MQIHNINNMIKKWQLPITSFLNVIITYLTCATLVSQNKHFEDNTLGFLRHNVHIFPIFRDFMIELLIRMKVHPL